MTTRPVSSLLLCSALLLAAACGSDAKQVGDLSVSEARALCNEVAADEPLRSVSCTNPDRTEEVGFDTDVCSFFGFEASCAATEDDFRDCSAALYAQSDADVCAGVMPPECQPFENASCDGE